MDNATTRRDRLNPRINRRVDEVPDSGSARQIIPERCTTAPAIDLRGNLSHGFETVSASSARQSSERKYGGYWIAFPGQHDASGVFTPEEAQFRPLAAHNEYLELLASGGLLGGGFSLAFHPPGKGLLRNAYRLGHFGRVKAILEFIGGDDDSHTERSPSRCERAISRIAPTLERVETV